MSISIIAKQHKIISNPYRLVGSGMIKKTKSILCFRKGCKNCKGSVGKDKKIKCECECHNEGFE